MNSKHVTSIALVSVLLTAPVWGVGYFYDFNTPAGDLGSNSYTYTSNMINLNVTNQNGNNLSGPNGPPLVGLGQDISPDTSTQLPFSNSGPPCCPSSVTLDLGNLAAKTLSSMVITFAGLDNSNNNSPLIGISDGMSDQMQITLTGFIGADGFGSFNVPSSDIAFMNNLYSTDGNTLALNIYATANQPQYFLTSLSVNQGALPEPATYLTLGAGLIVATALKRRRALQ